MNHGLQLLLEQIRETGWLQWVAVFFWRCRSFAGQTQQRFALPGGIDRHHAFHRFVTRSTIVCRNFAQPVLHRHEHLRLVVLVAETQQTCRANYLYHQK